MLCFSEDEMNAFLEAAERVPYYVLFFLALETGMRPEEYLGLQWSDIDFNKKRLAVRRVLIGKQGGGFVFDEPKTDRSRRSIPLTVALLDLLKGHRKAQLEQRLRLGTHYQVSDLVFTSEIGTPIHHRNLDRRHFKTIIASANENKETERIPSIRLYDLRHTMATLLLSAGVNPKIVSERLGHASIVLTLDTYSHVLPTMQEGATNEMELMMRKKSA